MTIMCMGEDFILGSKGVTGDNGIGYGGVDDGTHDPAAKEFKSIDLWDEEDEE
ncbi:MAG: hypothetical protein IJ891_07900 [Prevotella sp.]|nr:hypothetical protein [Prevotella sp.]